MTTIFLPTVAGSTPQQADAKLGRVSRLTVLVTVACSLLLIPVAWTGIHLVLPAYSDCLPAFLVLLPAVVSLSLAKVLTSYVAGRGRPGPISVAGISTLILNLAANLTLIPILGIVGASLSSLISYTAMAVIMLIETKMTRGTRMRGLIKVTIWPLTVSVLATNVFVAMLARSNKI